MLKLIHRGNFTPGPSLRVGLLSFGVGLSIFTPLTLIVAYLGIFGPLTTYVPLVAFDVAFGFRFIKGKTKPLNGVVLRRRIVDFLRNVGPHLLVVVFFFSLLYSLQIRFIDRYASYPAFDPYLWFGAMRHLQQTGTLDVTSFGVYPPGFITFCAAALSPSTDFYITYYFFKYVPLFFMGVNLLLVYDLALALTKKAGRAAFIVLISMSFNYVMYRYAMPLPSTMATMLALISFTTLDVDKPLLNIRGRKVGSEDSQTESFNTERERPRFKLRKGKSLSGVDKQGTFRRISLREILSCSIRDDHVHLVGIILGGIASVHPFYAMVFVVFFTSFLLVKFVRNCLNFRGRGVYSYLIADLLVKTTLLVVVGAFLLVPFIIGVYLSYGLDTLVKSATYYFFRYRS